jgi:UDP-glucuronate 4-epimerase
VTGVLDRPPEAGVARVLNIGDSRPVPLLRMIEVLEESLGRPAEKVFRPMQPGDVSATYADVSRLSALTGYAPKVPLEDGLPRFVTWYREAYGA